MKLSELTPKQSGVNVVVEVIDMGEVREFTKFGKVGRVCNAVVKDDSGQMKMTLWNDDIDKVKVGDTIKLTDGFVNEWQGEMQLTTGRAGKMEIQEIQASLKAEKPKKAKEKPAPVEEPEDFEEEDIDVEEEFIE